MKKKNEETIKSKLNIKVREISDFSRGISSLIESRGEERASGVEQVHKPGKEKNNSKIATRKNKALIALLSTVDTKE